MEFIFELLTKYGLLAMFIVILLEYACFPVSSEIVLPFCGAAASLNNTKFLIILLVSIIAGLIGTGICYTIAWFGGGAVLSTISRKFPKMGKGIAAANDKFNQNGAAAVCIGRVIPFIRTYIAWVAGAAKLNPVTYFTATALGVAVWNTLLIGLGYTLGTNYNKVAVYYDKYKHNLLPIAGICLAGLLFRYISRHRKMHKQC